MKITATDSAPKAVGPYSQAISCNGILYCAGQIPLDPITMQIVEGGIEEQAKQVLKNIDAVLQASGTEKNKVIKTTVFLEDMNDFPKMNTIYEEFFGYHKPARSTIQVAKLPKDALIEIEVIASTLNK